MKYLFPLLLCLYTCSYSYAQQESWHGIPDFIRVPEENRADSINNWYINKIPWKADRATQRSMLRVAMEYAEYTKDPITKEAVAYATGHFYRSILKDSVTAAVYFNESFALTEKYHLEYQWACHMHEIGMSYYYEHNNEAKCLEQLLIAEEVFKRLNLIETKTASALALYYNLGFFYYHLGNHRAVLKTLIPCLNYSHRTQLIYQLQFPNTIGLAYRELGKPDSAFFYFSKGLAVARQNGSKAWIGILSGNIADIYLRRQMYDSAMSYATVNNEYVKNNNEVSGQDKAEALIRLAQINAGLHKPDLALAQLSEAEKFMNAPQLYRSYDEGKSLRLKYYYLRSQLHKTKSNFANAYRFVNLAEALQDSINKSKKTALYTTIQVQIEAARDIARIRSVEDGAVLALQRRNFSLIALLLSGLIIFSLYKRQQLRNKKNRDIFTSREQLLYVEKLRAEDQLKGYMESMHEKNRLIEDFQLEIERLSELPLSSETQLSIETLEKLQQSTIITDDDWLRFKTLFENVHKGFFVRVKQKYPDITPSEIRLLALVKLRVPRKQMAGMLGISPDSIRKTSSRFIKKINSAGDPETDLSEIVASL